MKRGRQDLVALTALLVSVVLVASASAQSAAIRGRNVDEQGRAVPGATVTLTNPRTGLTRTNDSDGEGLYRLAGLPAGVYDIRVSLEGFTTVEQPATTVVVGAILHLDFALRVAAVVETVDIVAPSENLDFVQPTSFAGDFQQPVQRVGQLALRWSV